jgi:hypothetical protein
MATASLQPAFQSKQPAISMLRIACKWVFVQDNTKPATTRLKYSYCTSLDKLQGPQSQAIDATEETLSDQVGRSSDIF